MSVREMIRSVALDVRHAMRGYRSAPTFVSGVVLTLALGVGVNVAMFSIADRLMLRPPAHVRDPATLRRLYFTVNSPTGPLTTPAASYPVYTALHAENTPFPALAAYYISRTAIGRGTAARAAVVSSVTASLFPMLGAPAARGRYFDEREDAPPTGAAVAVISFTTWQQDFGGDPGVIGKRATIGGRDYEIVGVAPAGFTGPDLRPIDAWIPLSVGGAGVLGPGWYRNSGVDWLQIIVRLSPRLPASDAEAFATRTVAAVKAVAGKSANDSRPVARPPVASFGPIVRAIGPTRPKETGVVVWLAVMSGIVLLIACANVANLLLVRTLQRRREIAIRLAMGVTAARLAMMLWIDGLLLALIGGGIGVVAGRLSAATIGRLLLPDVDWNWMPFDARFASTAALLLVAVGSAISITPVLQSRSPRVLGALRSGASTPGGDNTRLRIWLVAAQAALCTFMLVGAGLFIRSLRQAQQIDAGFDANRTIVVTARLRDAGYAGADASQFFLRARDAVHAVPGVEDVARAIAAPFVLTSQIPPRIAPPYSLPAGDDAPYLNAVDADYLNTMGIRVIRGRGIDAVDVAENRQIALVNERMAAHVWPGEDAIGKCIRFGSDTTPCITIVGIVGDVHQSQLLEESSLQYYVPLGPRFDNQPGRVLLVRARQRPDAILHSVRAAILALAPNLPYVDVRPYRTILEPEVRSWRLGAILFTLFGALAALVAAVGLYSVMSYATAQRRPELALRMALGARGLDVTRVIVRGSIVPCISGVLAGLAFAYLSSQRVQPLLFRTSATDVRIFGVVAALLAAVGILAIVGPAVHAARTDPILALREP
ncbi:MAG TPA: ADOP family duplicated permease [Gemmatimonadaceae bacterium]|nr:ADOP family duplicated permease [Gemmatimonadaceae bacterium]